MLYFNEIFAMWFEKRNDESSGGDGGARDGNAAAGGWPPPKNNVFRYRKHDSPFTENKLMLFDVSEAYFY